MDSPTVCIRFMVARDERSRETGVVKVSLKIVDFASAVEKLRAVQVRVKAEKASRTIRVIKDLQDEPKAPRCLKAGIICKAVTLAGTPCKSRANCGAYCKRHFFVSK